MRIEIIANHFRRFCTSFKAKLPVKVAFSTVSNPGLMASLNFSSEKK